MKDKDGQWVNQSHVLIYQGVMLAYDPAMDEVIWMPMYGTSSTLTPVERKSAYELAKIILAPTMASGHEKMETDTGGESSCDSDGWDEEEEEDEEPQV